MEQRFLSKSIEMKGGGGVTGADATHCRAGGGVMCVRQKLPVPHCANFIDAVGLLIRMLFPPRPMHLFVTLNKRDSGILFLTMSLPSLTCVVGTEVPTPMYATD